MDKIKIENLEIFAYHGVFPQEKKNGQKFYINAILKTDLKKAGKTEKFKAPVGFYWEEKNGYFKPCYEY